MTRLLLRSVLVGAAVLLIGALLAGALLGCGPALDPLPEPPDLESVESSVRTQYEQLRGRLDAMGADAGTEEQADAHGELGLFFHAYRQPEAAELAYGDALKLAPDSERWSYFRGILLGQAGRLQEASRDFAMASRSGQAAAIVRLAETEAETGAAEAAISRLEPIVAGQRRNVRARAVLARALMGRAQASEEDRRRAATLLEDALRVQPGASGLRYRLAGLYRELGEDSRASAHLAHLQRQGETEDGPLLMSDPWGRELEEMDISYLGHLQRGRRAADRERHVEALRHFEKALEVDPSRFAAGFAAAKTLLALNRDVEARRRAESLLERFPDKAETHLLLGRLYRRDADPRAAESFENALELDAQSLPALRQLAAEKRQGGELDEAIDLLERAREQAPGMTQVILSLADVLIEAGRPEQAADMIEASLPNAREPWALQLRLEKLRETR